MPLTDKQIANINKLDADTAQEILHECAERLGLVTVKEYCNITGCNRRTAYSHIANGSLAYTMISNNIFVIINQKT
jgi:hypothetical protein